MIGAQYFPAAVDPLSWETSESGHLLALYGDKRIPIHKRVQDTGSSFHDKKVPSAPPSLPYGFPGRENESSGTADGNPSFTKPPEYQKSKSKMDATVKQASMFSKHDPRRVAVSWYSYYYLRPGSPTQWEQRDEKEIDMDERLRMSMGLPKDPASHKQEYTGPVKSDISVLEKLSKMVDNDNVIDQDDAEVQDIFSARTGLLKELPKGQFTKWQDLANETSQLLSELRRSSPPV